MFDIFNNADNESSLIQLMADYQNGDITKEEIVVQRSSCYAETDEDDDNRISSEDEDPVPVRKSAREPKPKKPFDETTSQVPVPNSSAGKNEAKKGKSRKLTKAEQKTVYDDVLEKISTARDKVSYSVINPKILQV